MRQPSLIIIGAGITGLMAAYELADNFDITILEAQEQTGGRIRTIYEDGHTIETGAEFVHGNLPISLSVLKKAGISTQPVKGEMLRSKNGSFHQQEEMIEGWDDVMKKMKSLTTDCTLEQFLDQYYPAPSQQDLRKEIAGYAEGFDLADIAKVSVKSLYKEWSRGDGENYRVTGGYKMLLNWLEEQLREKKVKLLTGAVVKKVDWSAGQVQATTATGKKFSAGKLLVTVPVSILAGKESIGSIEFVPSLNAYQQAASGIGFGGVIKVILLFRQRHWPANAGFIISDQLFRTWWTQLPGDMPMITGWLGGPNTAKLQHKTNEAIIVEALRSLSAIVKIPIVGLEKDLIKAVVGNWPEHDFIKGAYSYDTPASAAVKELLNKPVEDTLFFAGEALYNGAHPGTVEAALSSAIEVAKRIKKRSLAS